MSAAGMKTVDKDAKKLEKDAEKVVNEIISRGYTPFIRNIYDVKPFLDMVNVSGSTYYVNKVANLALLQIRALRKNNKKVEVPDTCAGSNLELIKEEKDETFLELILEKLRKYVDPDSIKYFAEWISGEPQRAIALRYKVSQAQVSTKIVNLRENALGYAAEDAFFDVLRTQYKNVEHFGANTPYPDFIVHDIRTVISFKTYFDPKLNKSHAANNIGKAEIQYAQENDYTLVLVMYEISKRKFYWYEVLL